MYLFKLLLNNVRIISFISILFIFGFCSSLLASEIHQVGDKFYSVAPGTEYITQSFTSGAPRIKTLKWKHTVYVECLCLPQSYDPSTQMTLFYCYKLSGGGVEEVPDPSTDTDADGLPDINDPCPDNADNFFKHYLAPNSCDGSYYFFQITGECGETKTYYNPKYSSVNEAYQDATANPNCSAEPEEKSVTPQQVANFFASNAGGSTAPAGSGVIPEDSVDLTGGNSTSTSPQEVTSDDPDTQKVIDAIKVMRETLEETLDKQTKKLVDSENLAADRIVSTLKSGNNLVSGRLSGVENAINVLKGNAGTYADQAHTDSENIAKSIKDLAKAVNGSGDVVEVSVNGTDIELPPGMSTELENPSNSTLEPVKEDRVEASKQKFFTALQNLIDQYSNIFELNLSGTGKLPVWHWVLMGQTVTIDFNDYATELNWLGLAVVLIATISAVFIVFD
ncbi:MAG: hypothetical protein PHS86_06345 [Syntrophaceae bacterium]|nr:hypothetical protein [Syntrophaceae bacterium]